MNAHAAKPDIRDVVGCTHTAGQYNFTDKDYLNEGADKLLELGTRHQAVPHAHARQDVPVQLQMADTQDHG